MQVCQLRLINEINVTTDIVDFLSLPFYSPINLRIPKATKRTIETADNMFRDGSDLSLIRYNNAVITMQPRFKVEGQPEEIPDRIEAIREKVDRILEAARTESLKGYGETVEFWDDAKGFVLVSRILDGDFDIEEDWDWTNVAQGAVLASSLSLTREPFRSPRARIYLENLCPNPGFEDAVSDVPSEWTSSNGSPGITNQDRVEGAYSGRVTCTPSATDDVIVSSADIALTSGQVYYLEAWVHVRSGDDVSMSVFRPVGTATLSPTVSWTSLEVPDVADDPRFYRSREYNTWSDLGISFPAQGFIRKGFTFTAPATDNYRIRFIVDKPSVAGDYLFDRLYLTPVENLPIQLPTGTTLDLSNAGLETANMKAWWFPTGWISFRDILNHHDDGTTDHEASASVSPSASKSPSASASTSPSASKSPSASVSVSPSASQSKSPSASSSPSASVSISPSSSASASVSPSTAPVVNNIGAHLNYVDFYDIPGDVPALAKVRIENTSGANFTQIFAGLRSFGSPAHQTHTSQIGGTPDPGAGQGNKSAFGPLSTTPQALSNSFDLSHSLSGLGNNTGAFRMLVRLKDTAAVQGTLRVRTYNQLMVNNTGYNNINITPPGPGATKWALVDTGVISIPLLSPDGSIHNFDGGVSLLVAWRTSGVENIEADYCQFFPADEYYCAASPSWSNTFFVNLNSLPGLPTCYLERYVSTIDIRMREIPAQATSKPLLAPNRQNRLFLSATRTLGEHVLNDSMRVAAQVLPRYL